MTQNRRACHPVTPVTGGSQVKVQSSGYAFRNKCEFGDILFWDRREGAELAQVPSWPATQLTARLTGSLHPPVIP